MQRSLLPVISLGLLLSAASASVGAAMSASLADCVGISPDKERLACFDRIAAGVQNEPNRAGQSRIEQARMPIPPRVKSESDTTTSSDAFSLASHWELGAENKGGTFHFRPHLPNYILATYTTGPNQAPYLPFKALAPDSKGLSHAELAYQIGFKMKGMENILNSRADLWFAYTQQSFWQAHNREASSPFRETNYQPELMLVMPVDYRTLGMDSGFINIGLVHQSNGQVSTLSRSWNRVYIQTGMEKGRFSLTARAWHRFRENHETDDNPNITDYMGHGDIVAAYRTEGHELSAMLRGNFSTRRGAVQLGWTFPMTSQLKGYVQVFSGYGQSLVDYNYSHKMVGLGLLVSY